MNFLSREYRNIKKRQVSDYFYKKIISEKYTNEQVGFLIKSLHMNVPAYCMVIMLFFSYIPALISYIFVCLVLCAFIYLNGCFLTLTEYRIDHQDVTMIDPVIMLCKDTITKGNRIRYSLLTVAIYMIVASLIMLLRFSTISNKLF